jgi:hypothetical protein
VVKIAYIRAVEVAAADAAHIDAADTDAAAMPTMPPSQIRPPPVAVTFLVNQMWYSGWAAAASFIVDMTPGRLGGWERDGRMAVARVVGARALEPQAWGNATTR